MHPVSGHGRGFFRLTTRRIATPIHVLCAAALVAFGPMGCASASSGAGGSPKASQTVITADEISKSSVQNAYDAVVKLRPTMLRPRQLASANAQANGELVVYVDNTRFGDAESLRNITASSINAIRYYSASEAQTKWGSGHPGGAIEVLTKR